MLEPAADVRKPTVHFERRHASLFPLLLVQIVMCIALVIFGHFMIDIPTWVSHQRLRPNSNLSCLVRIHHWAFHARGSALEIGQTNSPHPSERKHPQPLLLSSSSLDQGWRSLDRGGQLEQRNASERYLFVLLLR